MKTTVLARSPVWRCGCSNCLSHHSGTVSTVSPCVIQPRSAATAAEPLRERSHSRRSVIAADEAGNDAGSTGCRHLQRGSAEHVTMIDAIKVCETARNRIGRPHFGQCVRAGWFPIKVEALPEGTCVHAHVPVYQVPRHATSSSPRARQGDDTA